MKRWFYYAVVLLTGTGSRGAAELPRLRAKLRPLPGLPAYPYTPVSEQPKPTVTGGSLPRLTLGDPNAPAPVVLTPLDPVVTERERTTAKTVATLRKAKTLSRTDRVTTVSPVVAAPPAPATAAAFEMADEVLKVDHCSVSGVSVVLYPDGAYAVHFRADQNPLPADPLAPVIAAAPRAAGTNLDPNQFKRNKFYLTVRGYAVGSARAAIVDLPIEPFMVDRGKAVSGAVEGTSDAVRRNFAFVERIEVDFTYR